MEIIGEAASLEAKFSLAATEIFSVLESRPKDEALVLGLCGGRSVVGLLSAFQKEAEQRSRDLLTRLHFFMVDERIVPITSAESNFGGLKAQLFDRLLGERCITAEQLHPFTASEADAETRCDEYMRELEKLGGRFTVVVLGVGEDGHVAGLFPHHKVLTQSGLGFSSFLDSPKPPSARMTARRELVTSASLGVLLAVGEGKRGAWNSFIRDEASIQDCPARMVKTMSRCLVVTDLA